MDQLRQWLIQSPHHLSLVIVLLCVLPLSTGGGLYPYFDCRRCMYRSHDMDCWTRCSQIGRGVIPFHSTGKRVWDFDLEPAVEDPEKRDFRLDCIHNCLSSANPSLCGQACVFNRNVIPYYGKRSEVVSDEAELEQPTKRFPIEFMMCRYCSRMRYARYFDPRCSICSRNRVYGRSPYHR